MRNFVDLHTHSIRSDGQLTPVEVVRLAEGKRLAAVALTDHDTVAGLAEAERAARSLEVRFVPGVEVSAKFGGGTLHILGLGISSGDRRLGAVLRRLAEARRRRNPKIIVRLRAAGVDVTLGQWRQFAGESGMVGRLHLAKLLCLKGYAANISQAFGRYIGSAGVGFVDKECLTPAEVIDAIHAAGGLAVLAHPPELKFANFAQLDRFVGALAREARRLELWGELRREQLDALIEAGVPLTFYSVPADQLGEVAIAHRRSRRHRLGLGVHAHLVGIYPGMTR
ncbi:hypothetical protein LCGC14_2715580, partial [marine sediment metagenome]